MKIVLLGDGAVGKTSLRLRYMGLGFQSKYMMTIGADFAIKDIKTPDGRALKCQIWDLAGQQSFKRVRSTYYVGVHGALLVYDATRPETYQNIDQWVEELLRNSNQAIPVAVLANKVDLVETVPVSVSEEDGRRLCANLTEKLGLEVPYLETSAKTGQNVEEAFQGIAEQVVKAYS